MLERCFLLSKFIDSIQKRPQWVTAIGWPFTNQPSSLPSLLYSYTILPHYTVVYSGFSPPYYTVVYTLYSILYSCSPQGSKTQGYTSSGRLYIDSRRLQKASGWLYIHSIRPKKDVHTHRCSFVQGQTTFGQWLTYSMPSWLSWVSDVLLISSETMMVNQASPQMLPPPRNRKAKKC